MIPSAIWVLLLLIGLTLLLITAFGTGDLDVFDFPVIVFTSCALFFSGAMGISGVFKSMNIPWKDLLPISLGAGFSIPVTLIYSKYMQSSAPQTNKQYYKGALARVVHRVGTDEIGQIYTIDKETGYRVYFPALSLNSEPIIYSKNKEVRIVGFEGRTAIIIAKDIDSTATAISKSLKKNSTVICANCGHSKPLSADRCPDCGEKVLWCMVCRGEIAYGQNVLYCPHCGNEAHSSHILEWVKTKANCPICKEYLNAKDLISMKKGV